MEKFIERGIMAVFAIFSLLLYSCSDRNDLGDNGNIMQGEISSINLSGRWVGTASTSHMPLTEIEFKISQSGVSISGTFDFSEAGKGTLTGSFDGNRLDFLCDKSDNDCPGEFRGMATVDDDRMNFSLIGDDCKGTHKNGSGIVEKQ